MKTLTLEAYGGKHKIAFDIANYAENGNLYIGMLDYDEGHPEPWSDLTVNLSVKCAPDCAFIDTNNNGTEIVEWLEQNEIAELTGDIRQSGCCIYPKMRFNMDKLKQHCGHWFKNNTEYTEILEPYPCLNVHKIKMEEQHETI